MRDRKLATRALRRIGILASLALLAGLAPAAVAGAATGPVWKVAIHHDPTNLEPGSVGQYRLNMLNIGDEKTTGPTQLEVELAEGLTFLNAETIFPGNEIPPWECSADSSGRSIDCSTPYLAPRKRYVPHLVIRFEVAADASGVLTSSATISGGGAAQPFTEEESAAVSDQRAGFGIVPGSFEGEFLEPDGVTPIRQAGKHPFQAEFNFDFNSTEFESPVPFGYISDGTVRNLTVDLPPGFVGYPTAVGECTAAQLTFGKCPRGSQVGRIDVTLFPVSLSEGQTFTQLAIPVYNMSQPKGVITDLGFSLSGNPVHIRARLDPTDYSVETTVSHINESLPIFDQSLTIWGVPADASHDYERCSENFFGIEFLVPDPVEPCKTDQPRKAFLTVPSRCDADHRVELRDVDSWQQTGSFEPPLSYPEEGFQPTGCEKQRFEPSVSVHPVNQAANSPTGLDVTIAVPQNSNPDGLDSAHVKKTVVTFPEGMTVSPSFADGLSACSLQQIGLGNDDPVGCPGSSRIGTVDLRTPVLDQPLTGSMFLAEQGANPFGTLVALYVVLEDTEERGILIKLPGKLELDPESGQIVTTFDELPQFPFSELELHFRSGPRAPLINPASCGQHRIGVEITSYASAKPVDVSDVFAIDRGAAGDICREPAQRPFRPTMSSGTLNPSAGSYSPFSFRVVRSDADQELSRIEATLPPGLIARLRGVEYCPEAAIGSISGALGAAAVERAAPKCPASSRIGSVHVGVGAGPSPNYFPGQVFLAGPYKGAPLSMVVVIGGLAGPYDLGNVAVQTALHVDPTTAQVRAVSDPFPMILHGILLRVTDVRLLIDRPELMRNPTSCNPLQVRGDIFGTGGDVFSAADDSAAVVFNRFQVGNCASLGFKPRLGLRLRGGTKRGDYPALTATLTARPGDANIASTSVILPHSAFLAQEHIRTICTRVQFAAQTCPKGAVYGRARALSPLLDEPLEGPVYLRSSDNPLPDLVADLQGRFDIVLSGRIDSKHRGIRTRFSVVPDAPVTKFTLSMQGGKKGLLVNSRNLCRTVDRATVKMTAHNGKRLLARPVVKDGCKPRKGGKGGRRGGR